MHLLNVGHGNTVVLERIVAVINTGSSPARKLRETAKTDKCLLDLTEGRRTRSMIILDSGHVILSSVQTETISQRVQALRQDYLVRAAVDGKSIDTASMEE